VGGYDGFVFGVGDGVGLVFLPAVDEVEDLDVVVGAEFFGVGGVILVSSQSLLPSWSSSPSAPGTPFGPKMKPVPWREGRPAMRRRCGLRRSGRR